MRSFKGVAWADQRIYPVKIAYARSRKALVKLCKVEGVAIELPDDVDGYCTSFISKNGSAVSVVWVDRSRGTGDDVISVIAHECLHVVQFIRSYIGESDMGAESEAYLLQWVMSFILSEWRK